MEVVIRQISSDAEIQMIPEISIKRLITTNENVEQRIFENSIINSAMEEFGHLVETVHEDNISRQNNSGLISKSRANYDMPAQDLFNALAWHVNEVTNNKQSLYLSKGTGTHIALIDSVIDVKHPFL